MYLHVVNKQCVYRLFQVASIQKANLGLLKYLWLNTSQGTSWGRSSKLIFCHFLIGCSFSSILVQKRLKADIADCNRLVKSWFWEIKRLLKFCDSGQSIGVNNMSKVCFYMKITFLHQIIQAINKESIEESKICEISRSALWP